MRSRGCINFGVPAYNIIIEINKNLNILSKRAMTYV